MQNIDIYDLKKVFHSKHGHKLKKRPNFLYFFDEPFTENFAKQNCTLFYNFIFTP